MKETNTKEMQGEIKIKALLYGKPKTGKTFSALSLNPETTLILSAESGILPIKLSGKNYTVWEIKTFADMVESYKQLLLPENQKRFKVIFIDSLTEINELAKDQILKSSGPGKDKEMMTLQDYGLLLTHMIGLVRKYRDLPYHVIFTALEENYKDEQTGAVSFVCSLNGKFAVNIAGYFDEVFRMITKEEDGAINRYFFTAKIEKTITGDRSGALETFEQPSWKIVFEKIFKKFKVKEEK